MDKKEKYSLMSGEQKLKLIYERMAWYNDAIEALHKKLTSEETTDMLRRTTNVYLPIQLSGYQQTTLEYMSAPELISALAVLEAIENTKENILDISGQYPWLAYWAANQKIEPILRGKPLTYWHETIIEMLKYKCAQDTMSHIKHLAHSLEAVISILEEKTQKGLEWTQEEMELFDEVFNLNEIEQVTCNMKLDMYDNWDED